MLFRPPIYVADGRFEFNRRNDRFIYPTGTYTYLYLFAQAVGPDAAPRRAAPRHATPPPRRCGLLCLPACSLARSLARLPAFRRLNENYFAR